jgi:hypothetical protein
MSPEAMCGFLAVPDDRNSPLIDRLPWIERLPIDKLCRGRNKTQNNR